MAKRVHFTPPRHAAGPLAVLVVASCLAGSPAIGDDGPAGGANRTKLDPALRAEIASRGGAEVSAWIEFADKGDDSPEALARARDALTPRARARRTRAGTKSLVDESDLPVHQAYLDSLAAHSVAVRAVSRWFNRALVRVTPERLEALGSLACVARMSRVERAVLRAYPAGDPIRSGAIEARPESGAEPLRAGRTLLDAGLNASPLAQIGASALHDSGYTGSGVLVAVFDEGFNAHDTHEALVTKPVAPGFARDFVDGDTVVTDLSRPGQFSHGTWVLGCLAGNRPGTYLGAAPGADIALARTEYTGSETPVEMVNWGLAAEWADSLGADVIHSSVAYQAFDDPYPDISYPQLDGHTTDISRAAEIAASKGILLVNSVGNSGGSGVFPWLLAPADVHGDSLIAVGAVDAFGNSASFSSIGPSADGRIKPDLVARGVASPFPSASGNPTLYESNNGTSFSAPLVAGLTACLLQARPQWTAVDVIRTLRETASQSSSPDNKRGYGVPNGAAALSWQAGFGAAQPGQARMLGPNPLVSGGASMRVLFTAGGVIASPSTARVRVHDALGRRSRGLWEGKLARGESLTVTWDGRDGDGTRVPPGIYYIALTVGGETTAARAVVLH